MAVPKVVSLVSDIVARACLSHPPEDDDGGGAVCRGLHISARWTKKLRRRGWGRLVS